MNCVVCWNIRYVEAPGPFLIEGYSVCGVHAIAGNYRTFTDGRPAVWPVIQGKE